MAILDMLAEATRTLMAGPNTSLGGCPPVSPDSAFCPSTCPNGFSVWGAYHGPISGTGYFFERLVADAGQGILPNTAYTIRIFGRTFSNFQPHGARAGSGVVSDNVLADTVTFSVPETALPGFDDVTVTTDDDATLVVDIGHWALIPGYANIVYVDGLWVFPSSEGMAPPILSPDGCPIIADIFTPEINWSEPLTERFEHETSIFSSQGERERRASYRDLPHRRFNYLVTAGEAQEAGFLESLIYWHQDKLLWIPYWRGEQYLGVNRSIGQTSLAINTVGRGFIVGGGVMFWHSFLKAEVAVVTAVATNLLSFSALTRAWKDNDKVMPAFLGYVAPTEDLDYANREIKLVRVTADLVV